MRAAPASRTACSLRVRALPVMNAWANVSSGDRPRHAGIGRLDSILRCRCPARAFAAGRSRAPASASSAGARHTTPTPAARLRTRSASRKAMPARRPPPWWRCAAIGGPSMASNLGWSVIPASFFRTAAPWPAARRKMGDARHPCAIHAGLTLLGNRRIKEALVELVREGRRQCMGSPFRSFIHSLVKFSFGGAKPRAGGSGPATCLAHPIGNPIRTTCSGRAAPTVGSARGA